MATGEFGPQVICPHTTGERKHKHFCCCYFSSWRSCQFYYLFSREVLAKNTLGGCFLHSIWTPFLSLIWHDLKVPQPQSAIPTCLSPRNVVSFCLPLQSFLPPHPPPNDVLTKIRLRRESLNSVQKLSPREVKGSLVSHISPNYF